MNTSQARSTQGEASGNSHPADKEKPQLHFEFVGMLFALAIAQVAVEAAKVVEHQTANRQFTYLDYLPAYTHLLLATVVIAASWVGWGAAKSNRGKSEVENVFSCGFVELLIDVFLVVCYFIIANSVDELDDTRGVAASTSSETLWSAVILYTYVVWDCVTKGLSWSNLKTRMWASVGCAGLAILAWNVIPSSSNPWQVVFADASLIVLFLLFRALKLHNLRDHTAKSIWLSVVLGGLFIALLICSMIPWQT